MISTIFIALLLIFIYIRDKNRLGILISPSICFILPTFIVAVLYDVFGARLGFYTLNRTIYLYIFISSFFFIIGGELACSFKRVHNKLIVFEKQISIIRGICLPKRIYKIILLIVILLFFRLSSLGGISVLLDADLQKQYASGGFYGHILVLAIFSIILLLSIQHLKSKRFLNFLLLVGVFISVVFYQVKSWLIFPIIASIFYKICIGVKQSFLKYGIVLISIVGCFILGYAFTYSLNDTDNQLFILNHFLKYIVAGVGGWSEALTDSYPTGQNPMYLLQPFSNILGINQARVDARYEFIFINVNGEYTNVFTLIGSALLFAGPLRAYAYFTMLGFVSYYLAVYCIKRTNTGTLLVYSILCTSLFLGFFGSYFTLLNIYELMLYAFLLKYFIRKMNAKQNRIIECRKE